MRICGIRAMCLKEWGGIQESDVQTRKEREFL